MKCGKQYGLMRLETTMKHQEPSGLMCRPSSTMTHGEQRRLIRRADSAMTHGSQRGFTLLEMMIALMLLAVIGVAGLQILQGVLRSGEISREHSERLGAVQRAFSLLEQDISQALEPLVPAQPPSAAVLPQAPAALPVLASADGGPTLRLLRRNWLNPGDYLPRASLQQVQWLTGENGLQRRGSVALLQASQPSAEAEASDMPPSVSAAGSASASTSVSTFGASSASAAASLSAAGRSATSQVAATIVNFPQITAMRLRYWHHGRWQPEWFAAYALPQAIEVTLTVDGYGDLQRLFFITETR